jgi:hypothetical protein
MIDVPPGQLLERARASFRKGVAVASNLATYTERRVSARSLARDLSRNERDAVGAMRATGFHRLSPDFDRSSPVVSLCRRLIDERADSTPRNGKTFFAQLVSHRDLAEHPCLLEVGLDPIVLRIVAATYGIVPFLESVELLVSFPEPGGPRQSQLWHIDRTDSVVVKQVVYIDDVADEQGPFSLLPKTESRKVPTLVKHYLDDGEISRHVDMTEVVRFRGEAGSRALVDTGNCFHYGSRGTQRRHALFFYYNTGYGKYPRLGKWRGTAAATREWSPLQRHVLDID